MPATTHHLLHIKNMVCNRCISAVKNILAQAGVQATDIQLGEVTLSHTLIKDQINSLSELLSDAGFDLIDDRKSRIIEKIKTVAITLVHRTDEPTNQKTSEIISAELHYDYPYLSNLFSATEGITIEQYIIRQKVEKIKEYVVYDELSLGEIADKMGYSSVAHLSTQFKKITGMTPSQFKNLDRKERKPLDKVMD